MIIEVIKVKIEQVPQLRKILKSHAGKNFAEATNNVMWGTGVPLSLPSATNKDMWKGKNILGNIFNELSKQV